MDRVKEVSPNMPQKKQYKQHASFVGNIFNPLESAFNMKLNQIG